jgi:predicted butyrate kinase (DUF1464 family)
MATSIQLDVSPFRSTSTTLATRIPPRVQFAPMMGAQLAAPACVPGGAVISAAVGRGSTSYASGAGYSAVGAMNADLAQAQAENQRLLQAQQYGGGGFGSVGSMNADLLRQQAANQQAYQAQRMAGSGSSTTISGMNSDLVQSQADNAALLKVQIALQHENQVFSSVSNVLKTRHDTVKNSIGNIR